MLVPTCECGVVPIARRMLQKNVPAHVTMTYMLSAPVINPLVLAATYAGNRGVGKFMDNFPDILLWEVLESTFIHHPITQ